MSVFNSFLLPCLEELKVIFMHEFALIKRHDLEMEWISIMITMIHWFNPIAYWLFRQIYIWSENGCDVLAYEKTGVAIKHYMAGLKMMTKKML